MSDAEDPRPDTGEVRDEAPDAEVDDRVRVRFKTATASARSASERHVSIAVPFRAAERNRRVAASVLAGGLAYRIFLWLLPFGLIVGGALGLGDADDIEDAVADGGLPGGGRRRDRRRCACRGSRFVVAPRGRRAAPPLGGVHGREGGTAHSFAHLGRASSADQAATGVTRLHRHGVRLPGRSRAHLVAP